MLNGFSLTFPQATEVLKLSPGLHVYTPAGLLPRLQLITLSLHFKEIQFSLAKKKQSKTNNNKEENSG